MPRAGWQEMNLGRRTKHEAGPAWPGRPEAFPRIPSRVDATGGRSAVGPRPWCREGEAGESCARREHAFRGVAAGCRVPQ